MGLFLTLVTLTLPTRQCLGGTERNVGRTLMNATLGPKVPDLAKAAGIDHNTVNRFEVGRYAGTPATLAAIKKGLEKARRRVHQRQAARG
jgi:hypothetical protein